MKETRDLVLVVTQYFFLSFFYFEDFNSGIKIQLNVRIRWMNTCTCRESRIGTFHDFCLSVTSQDSTIELN